MVRIIVDNDKLDANSFKTLFQWYLNRNVCFTTCIVYCLWRCNVSHEAGSISIVPLTGISLQLHFFMELHKDYVYFYDSTCHILSCHAMNIFYIYNHTPIHKSPKAQRRSRHILVPSALFFVPRSNARNTTRKWEVCSCTACGMRQDMAGHRRFHLVCICEHDEVM